MRRILAGAIAAVCLSPIALRAEVVRFDIVERHAGLRRPQLWRRRPL